MDNTNQVNDIELTKDIFEFTHKDEKILDVVEGSSLNFWKDAWLRLLSNKAAIVSMVIIILFLLFALIIPILTSHGVNDQDTARAKLPPRIPYIENLKLPFIGELGIFDGIDEDGVNEYKEAGYPDDYFYWGTDELGRDIFTRVWQGVRISLLMALTAALIDFFIGIVYGGVSGYFGGWIDIILQRFIEIIASIPGLIVAILFVIFLGSGVTSIILALIITSWIGMSRVVRAQFIKNRDQEYVLAARTLGASDKRLIFKHLFPNIIGQVVVVTTFSIPGAIFYEAFLSFLGLGIVDPNQTSLGQLISKGQSELLFHPYMLLYPAIILSILMLCFNLLANGLRDALDPKMRGK